MGINDREMVQVETSQGSIELIAAVDGRTPAGVALLPRGMGIPVRAPEVVAVRAAQVVEPEL